jgi:hypothetical protein
MSTTTPPVSPATHCPSCGEEIADARARFCATCGRQLMRPDLRAHHILADEAPSVAQRQPRAARAAQAPPPDLAAEPPAAPPPAAPLVAWPAAPVAPPASPSTQRGLAGALGAVVVLALLAITATVILAVTRHDSPTPNVTQGQSTVSAGSATTAVVP